MPETYGLFSVPVAKYELNRAYTRKEMSCMKAALKKSRRNVGNQTSRNRNVLDLSDLADLKNFCSASVNEFGKNVMQVVDGKPKITQSWLNRSTVGQQHHRHKHPNSVWSGVLYIEVGESDKIMFHNENGMDGSFQFEVLDFNQHNSPSWWIPVNRGELLIFPSQLSHSVPPTESEERISLSFNTFPTEDFGLDESLSLLPIATRVT